MLHQCFIKEMSIAHKHYGGWQCLTHMELCNYFRHLTNIIHHLQTPIFWVLFLFLEKFRQQLLRATLLKVVAIICGNTPFLSGESCLYCGHLFLVTVRVDWHLVPCGMSTFMWKHVRDPGYTGKRSLQKQFHKSPKIQRLSIFYYCLDSSP